MLRKEFFSSVVVQSVSAKNNLSLGNKHQRQKMNIPVLVLPDVSFNSRQRKYSPRVLFNALKTSLQQKRIYIYF